MTKNIILTLVISLLAASLGFTSCKNKSEKNTVPTDSLMVDSFNVPAPDTTINRSALTDSSWHKAAAAVAKLPATPQDTAKNSVKKTTGMPKLLNIGANNPMRPQELLDGLDKAKKGDLRGAITDFDRCIEKNAKNYNAYFYKAKALIELNDPQNALLNLNLAIDNNATNPVVYYFRGKLHFDSGNTDKAFADFDKAVSLNPRFADALNYRGVCKEITGKHTEAIEDYKSAIESNPKFAIAYYNKGTSEAALALYIDATASFSKCIEIDPKKTTGFMNRGNCYVMLKNYKSAIDDYTTAISLEPNNADAYYNRGAAYEFSGDKNACNDWQKAESLGNKKAAEMLIKYCK